MNKAILGSAISLAVVAGVLIVRADNAAQAPATQPTSRPHHALKVSFEPYDGLTDLTDDQKSQINEIHKKMLIQRHELEQNEQDDISALLSDQQKTELDQLLAAKKEKAATKRPVKKKSTTAPADAG